MAVNVLGTELQECGFDPLAGFYRDGCCNTGADDLGVHTVCALVTAEFLDFSARAGNDLSTPRPGFDGLQPGDRWCRCGAACGLAQSNFGFPGFAAPAFESLRKACRPFSARS